MKVSMILAVVAAALCVTGCKYDKAGASGNGDLASGSDIESLNGSDVGRISDFSEGKFEDMYTRCTDVNFSPVYFAFDSDVVPHTEISKADAVVQHLNDNSDRVVVIEGNCDERGSNEYNMALGELRAVAVRNYLVNAGIGAERIQTRSYGSEKPAADGHDESAWKQNRRDEFAIFQK